MTFTRFLSASIPSADPAPLPTVARSVARRPVNVGAHARNAAQRLHFAGGGGPMSAFHHKGGPWMKQPLPRKGMTEAGLLARRLLKESPDYNATMARARMQERRRESHARLLPVFEEHLQSTDRNHVHLGDVPRHSVLDPNWPHYELVYGQQQQQQQQSLSSLSNERRLDVGKEGSKCRTVFTVSSGRSGTSWMKDLFSQLPSVIAQHEPDSSVCGDKLMGFLQSMGESFESSFPARSFILDPSFKNDASRCFSGAFRVFNSHFKEFHSVHPTPNNNLTQSDNEESHKNQVQPLYMQTSHLFFKNYQDLAIAQVVGRKGCKMDIVLLRRDIVAVLSSLHRLNFCRDVKAHWYYTLRHRSVALIPYLAPPRNDTPPCLWDAIGYLADVEAHFQLLRKLYQGHPLIAFHEISLEDHLLGVNGLEQFLDTIDYAVDFERSIQSAIRAPPVNTKTPRQPTIFDGNIPRPYAPPPVPLTDEQIVNILAVWISEYTRAGVPLPSTLLHSLIPLEDGEEEARDEEDGGEKFQAENSNDDENWAPIPINQ